MTNAQTISDVTAPEFEQKVIQASRLRPVLVDFWAQWCAPCKALAPVLQQLADKYAEKLSVVKVDTDRESSLALEQGIRSLPTVRLYHHAQVVQEILGAQPLAVLESVVAPYIARESDVLRERAEALLRKNERTAALALLQQALEADPNNYRIHPQLAALLIDTGELDRAEQVLKELPANEEHSPVVQRQSVRLRLARLRRDAPAPVRLQSRLSENPKDPDARYYSAVLSISEGRYTEALDSLLGLVREKREYKDDAARKTMLDVFALLGDDDPAVKEYRTQLARALN